MNKSERLAELEAENEALKRKLAEQQAGGKIAAWRVGSLAYTDYGYAVRTAQQNMLPVEELVLRCGEELNNLLAKAKEDGRKEAVPEGWQAVPKEPTEGMVRAAFRHCYIDSPIPVERECYRVMLAAAPKP